MTIADPTAGEVCHEYVIVQRLLPLAGARVLELGCGQAAMTRVIAQGGPRGGAGGARVASIVAFEVDRIQYAKLLQIDDLPNVSFRFGGAEAIPEADASFDIVVLFKSLHHVPTDQLDRAMEEIRRVLKPGGLAYVSEPVYAGDFNEILRLFRDERIVREAAFAAVRRAVDAGRMALVSQTFFSTPAHFNDFAQFEEQVLGATHSSLDLSPEGHAAVRAAFERHMTPGGADFEHPIRVDLLRKPAAASGAGP
jgi:SAM-dependent methyltransferase